MTHPALQKVEDLILTAAAYVFVRRSLILELVAFWCVIHGVASVYSPAGWIVAGVALWYVARGLEMTDAS